MTDRDSKVAFTPGPWVAAEGEGRVYRYANIYRYANTGEHTARIETISRGSSYANARLIAAAPELYIEAEESAALFQDLLNEEAIRPSFAARLAVALVNTNIALAKARGDA